MPEDQTDDNFTSMASLFPWAHSDCEEDNIPKVFAANQSRNTSDTSFINVKQTAYTGRASQAGNDSSYVHMLENHLF
jgi:hypothetical protein